MQYKRQERGLLREKVHKTRNEEGHSQALYGPQRDSSLGEGNMLPKKERGAGMSNCMGKNRSVCNVGGGKRR